MSNPFDLILDDVADQRANRLRLRKGVVTQTSPLQVKLGGSDTAVTAAHAGGQTLSVNDNIMALTTDGFTLVIGRLS